MTGLYSETQDDSSADLPQDTESDSLPSSITVTTNYDLVQNAQSVTVSTTLTNPAITTTSITSSVAPDTVIKCHSRQPSASIMDREKTLHNDDIVDDELLKDCGILSCRPARVQKLARIKVCVMIHPLTFVCITISFFLADFRSPSFHARHTATSFKFRLHKFRHHDNRKTFRHPKQLLRTDSVKLRDRKCYHGHICELFGQSTSHPCVDRNW